MSESVLGERFEDILRKGITDQHECIRWVAFRDGAFNIDGMITAIRNRYIDAKSRILEAILPAAARLCLQQKVGAVGRKPSATTRRNKEIQTLSPSEEESSGSEGRSRQGGRETQKEMVLTT